MLFVLDCSSFGQRELFQIVFYVPFRLVPMALLILLTMSYFLVIQNTTGSSCIYPTTILVSAISPRSSTVFKYC